MIRKNKHIREDLDRDALQKLLFNDIVQYKLDHPELYDNSNKDDDDSDEEKNILGDKQPKDDPTYKALTLLNQDLNGADLKFKKNLLICIRAHNEILNLYDNYLYDETWNSQTVNKFTSLLDLYKNALQYIDEHNKEIVWNYTRNKVLYYNIYNNIIKTDFNSFNNTYMRHTNYKCYRINRKIILLQISHIINDNKVKSKIFEPIFEYFNNKCVNIPLYSNQDKERIPTVFKKTVLQNWISSHISEVCSELDDEINVQYEREDVYNVFNVYLKARILSFKIFNMMTSSSKYNGIDKWGATFNKFCNGILGDSQMRKLCNAAKSENNFDNFDDYNQEMDDRSWNNMKIYESWWDDELENYYKDNKERFTKDHIKKIDMVSPNANVCKVITDGKYVYSNVVFYPGDIVEICPTKPISKSALYSKDMRDVVFEVIPNKEWALPFGYCQYYDIPNADQKANCDFIWDPINKVIVIKAINKIAKHTKLILKIAN